MAFADEYKSLVDLAKERFEKNDYLNAEPLLQKALLKNNKDPEVFFMLGTIFYEGGKFSKATKAYKRALEIDPSSTDANIGLSLLYNDLGKYEEGQKAFDLANSSAKTTERKVNPQINEILTQKHKELGDLYVSIRNYDEALGQYYKSAQLSKNKPEVMIKISQCYLNKKDVKKAEKILKNSLRDHSTHLPTRTALGVTYYKTNRVAEAVEIWESVIQLDPQNKEVSNYLNVAKGSGLMSTTV